MREARVNEMQSRIVAELRVARGDRLRVAVERVERAFRAEPVEDRGAVAAASEGRVDVDSRGADRERVQHFREEYGTMTLHVWLTARATPARPAGRTLPSPRAARRPGAQSSALHPTARTCCPARSASPADRAPRIRAAPAEAVHVRDCRARAPWRS